ncbi:polymeric immunoglobulin receptor-like [Amphiprion ocellaris]|uniref:polymeric immunoglobulin receptor-like n=1 Tax=Amphiprion ocellaris TaxID=80972 RepID=UPI0024112594|nr:polymeric immunoglobulin receptor-like [Amphiprion ocellaris]
MNLIEERTERKVLIMILFVSSTAQHIKLIAAKINVFPNAEGTNGSIICSFGSSGGRKFFCRRECKEEDVLIKTDEDTSQNGRYSVQYEHKSAQRGFLTVNIAQLIKSDSGRYRCGLGGSLVPQRYVDFDIKVTDGWFTTIYTKFLQWKMTRNSHL